MRVLLLMRGTPSCGKSTWIKENGLEEYALSADNIRMLYRSRVLNSKGRESIDQSVNSLAWRTLFEILEKRMAFGEFTVIDACNSKAKELNAYKSLAEQYRYRIYCVDFTDIPVEKAKEWNKKRVEYKRVPEEAIDLYYSRFETQKIPSSIKVVSRETALDEITFKPINLDEYENIYVIGDVHGCNTALQTLLKDGICDNNYYIFLGDYLDRGIENKEVLEFIISIKDKPNVCLLEGNHEIHLWNYGNDLDVRSNEFINYTLNQIKEIDKKELRQLYRKFRQCAYFVYNGQTYFCCHAGISAIRKNPVFIATQDFIKGIGTYEEVYKCEETFDVMNPDIIQIHGHRNLNETGIKASKNCYNLEGKVEFGGYLRAVKINKRGIEEISVLNTTVADFEARKPEEVKTEIKETSIEELVNKFRKNTKTIKETSFKDYDISSFNFSKKVFFDKNWNDLTMTARGLFINTEDYSVASRAYEKFFNIGETRETELGMLSRKLSFPVNFYLKYNGFLGILGYDKKNDKLLFCSKSSITGEFSKYFEDIFMKNYSDKYDEILEFIKKNNVSMIFEVIDKDNDPHIIEYDKNELVLLDIVKRKIEFEKFKFEDLCNIANKFGLKHKELAYTVRSWGEFMELYNNIVDEDYTYLDNRNVEGFVIEDSKCFMTKLKGYYYNFWKFMRKVKDEVFRVSKNGNVKGYIERTSMLTNAESNLFYGFIKDLASNGYDGKTDIITLRNLYLKNKENN